MRDDIIRAADAAQYHREPMPEAARKGPTVTLLNATPDPLGSVAALCEMYKGAVVRSLEEVTNEMRAQALADMLATKLQGPLESVLFHFVLEGVDRAFTHQAVRQRKAFFAQESLRFAVAEDWAHEVPLPPSLAGLRDDDPRVRIWRKGLIAVEDAYEALVSAGMPAEEARGLLPHAITTRYHWVVDLRGLLIEAGKRTCTQAQFHWRVVFGKVAEALRNYRTTPIGGNYDNGPLYEDDAWQFEQIANLIRPVCYQDGRCGFMAQFDRGCTIRSRVDFFAEAGIPSSEWDASIDPREWAADPGAART
jgi:thymidylate synthase (FAD)